MLNCIYFQLFQDNHHFKIKRFNQVRLARQDMKNIYQLQNVDEVRAEGSKEAENEFILNYDLNTDLFQLYSNLGSISSPPT